MTKLELMKALEKVPDDAIICGYNCEYNCYHPFKRFDCPSNSDIEPFDSSKVYYSLYWFDA